MSETSKAARAAMKAKAKRMADGHNEKVDASSWEPGQTFSAEKKKGPRPLNPREYKRGGKVVEHVEGRPSKEHHVTKKARHPAHECRVGNKPNYEGGTRPTGGRIARADGGSLPIANPPKNKALEAGLLGGVGAAALSGLKTGGRAMRKSGGRAHSDEAQDKKLIKREVKEKCLTREAHKRGGKAGKGKTNINIIIGGSHRDPAPPMPPPPAAAPVHPPGMFPPGQQGGMPQVGAGGPPPMNPALAGMMPRKRGGRARSYKDMEYGSGSGEGRLQKTEIAE